LLRNSRQNRRQTRGLPIPPPRADGLHPLASLIASLELADEVRIDRADRDEVSCPGVDSENLALRALEAYRDAAGGEPAQLRIEIEKRIPVAAGLGGGSADAAAVLRAANELNDRALAPDELRAVAARVGSDVPALIEPEHAVVGGVGEVVEPIELPLLHVLLVPADDGLLTRDVYAAFDRLVPSPPEPDPAALHSLAAASPAELADRLANDLQPAALSLRPELERQLADLLEAGALGAEISGSGPTAFGIFETAEAVELAAASISDSIPTRSRMPNR
jgi:4-diphosphocytidyl-2-C-methyl-D-erythritol kinase